MSAVEYRITFELQYRYLPHPTFPDAHPDGYLTIVCSDEQTAINIAHAVLDSTWAFHYPAPFNEKRWAQNYPLGELARINVSLEQGRAVNGVRWAVPQL